MTAVAELGHRGGGKTAYLLALGCRLKSAREARGLSLDDAEEESGGRWKAQAILSYERGDRRVFPEKLVALAGFYRVHPAWLLTGENPLSAASPEFAASWLAAPPLVTGALTAITGAARSGVTEQLRQRLLLQAERPEWDATFNGAVVITKMAELIGGPL